MDTSIMVVEDEYIIANDIKHSLEGMGYKVRSTVSSGEEAVERVSREKPDLVLMDIVLRDKMDGIEAAGEIGSRFNIPVVFLTSYADEDVLLRAKAASPFGYLVKPFDDRELNATIQMALDRVTLEAKLCKSEERFRIVADFTYDWEYWIAPDGGLIYVSPSCQRITGYRAEEFIDDPGLVVAIAHPDDKESLAEHSHVEIECKEAQSLTFRIITRDGQQRWIEHKCQPVYGSEGLYRGRRASNRDVTEHKEADIELAKVKLAAEVANRSKSEFLANMSHEIRTPMTPILGYVDLLMTGELSLVEQASSLLTIKRNGEVLLQLINDILDLSKIEAGKMMVERTGCSPWQVVEDMVSLMQVKAEDKNLKLMAEYAFPLPVAICTDQVRLRQILMNLIANAIKFTKDGNVRVTVCCTQETDTAARMQFAVTDTGIGMTPEETTRLFQPFTQADASTMRHFGGTGLGLAISKRLANLLGGDIDIQSEPCKGSTFTLTIDPGSLDGIPMLRSSPSVLVEKNRPAEAKGKLTLRGRVLLAEDKQDIQRLVCLILKKVGLEVDVAENGQIAYDKVLASESEGRPYNLILMNIQMSELDGYEVARRLRLDGWDGPIVALTAQAIVGDCEKCLQAGCDGYLAKPMDQTELLNTIARHLGQTVSAARIPASHS